jgi:hypothetical protein
MRKGLAAEESLLMVTLDGAYCISKVSSFDAGRSQSLASQPESQGAAETILDCPFDDAAAASPLAL